MAAISRGDNGVLVDSIPNRSLVGLRNPASGGGTDVRSAGKVLEVGKKTVLTFGPPRYFRPISRFGPHGAYGGPTAYEEIAKGELATGGGTRECEVVPEGEEVPEGPIVIEAREAVKAKGVTDGTTI